MGVVGRNALNSKRLEDIYLHLIRMEETSKRHKGLRGAGLYLSDANVKLLTSSSKNHSVLAISLISTKDKHQACTQVIQ